MSIPAAREKLLKLADRLAEGTFGKPGTAREIRQIVEDHMYRESPVRRAKPRVCKLTPELAEQIRKAAAERPEASMLELANYFGSNPGRVSEALNYKV